MSDTPANDDKDIHGDGRSELDEAAQEGQLPYVAEENEAAERGEDQSDTADPDQEAEQRGEGDVVGGINMR